MKENPSQLLKTALLINATFSFGCGLVCLLFADFLSPWTAIPTWILYCVGAGLLIFAADVAVTATRISIRPFSAKLIIGADVGWVLASVGILIFFGSHLTLPGQLLIELIAIAVAVLATVQAVGLRQMRDATEATA